jgi:bacillithiol biosynthesis cysteine-adding enzyme BshC
MERIARARLAAEKIPSPSLIAILRDQQANLPPSLARVANMQALAGGKTTVVATGQQVGLFLGPLYAFYKAASAIAVARAIETESGVRCVPLFWLQTEDHDFAEIRSCMVADREGQPVRLTLPDGDGHERSSVAYRILPYQITELVDALAEALGPGPAADETLALVRKHYRPGRSMAEAFAGLIAAIFADEGLLVLDPREARVAELAAPLYRTCLDDSAAIERLLLDRRSALLAAGFKEQVAVREHGALIFFHRDGPKGPRFRLIRKSLGEENGWTLAGGRETLHQSEVTKLLATDPLRFSTSALLRPVVQDALLPTVAYVGGPGEIDYFAQMEPLYAHFGLTPPLLVPRARFRCVDARARRWLREAGLKSADLSLPRDALWARLAAKVPAGAKSPTELRSLVASQIGPAIEAIAASVSAAGDHLARPIQRTHDSVFHAINRLIERYEHSLIERDETSLHRIQRLEKALQPDGIPQERYYGWPSLAGRVGAKELKRLVLQKLQSTNVFVTEVWDLEP